MEQNKLTAQQIIDAIHASRATGDKQGLRNTLALLDRLGLRLDFPAVHVAGTNGKGSVCAMTESILRRAGLHTGLYTSPFLQSYHERIRLDGLPMTDGLLERYGGPVLAASAQLAREGIHATPFEHGTALAFSLFEGERVDAAVCEVGLGGREDPTNVLLPRVSAITAIGLDHMSILGNTVEEIALQKAGIMKPGVPSVCQCAVPSVEAVFRREAERLGVPLRQLRENMADHIRCDAHGSVADYRLEEDWPEVRLSLPGRHQVMNAMTAIAVTEELRKRGMAIPREAVYEGLAATVWPARLEWCGDLLLDGAHNAHGIGSLRRFTEEQLAEQPRTLLTGVLTEKLSEEMLDGLAALADEAVTVTPDSSRAMDAETYAARLREHGVRVTVAKDLEAGLALARRKQAEKGGIIIACGSLYFAGALRGLLGLPWR